MPSAKNKSPMIDEKFPLGPGTFALESSQGRWKAFKHLIIVIELLMYLVQGRFNRLMVFMPPRHGKSWLISKYFLAWFLGSFPDLRIILTTHTHTFSAKWGRITKQLLERYGKKLFVKEIKLDKDSNASYRWDIEGHEGGLFTSGTGGAILGEGAHGLIIDDPTKGFKKANSKIHQQELNDWFYTEASTRLDKDQVTGKDPWIIYIAQRLGKKDLAGQILDGLRDEDPGEPHINAEEAVEILRNGGSIEKGTWVVLNLPALAEENDILNREPGEALCPSIKDESDLKREKANMGSFRFEAIFQGNPQEREGKIFKRKWFLDERGEVLTSVLTNSNHLPDILNEMRYWDFAASGEEGDTASGLKTGYFEDILVFRNLVHDKFTAKQMVYTYETTTLKDGKQVPSVVEQEPASMSKMLIQKFLDLPKLQWFDIQSDKVSPNKLDRAFDLEVMVESNRIKFDVDSMPMEDIKKIINELIEFTGEEGGEDNIVDTATGAARYWVGNNPSRIYM